MPPVNGPSFSEDMARASARKVCSAKTKRGWREGDGKNISRTPLDTSGSATYLGTLPPSLTVTMATASGFIACPASGKPLFWTWSSDLALINDQDILPQTRAKDVAEPPPGSKQCQHLLDPYGRHAVCCTKGLHTCRHDRIRDFLTKLARQAGLTATTEQAMLIPDQIQPDGQRGQCTPDPLDGCAHH